MCSLPSLTQRFLFLREVCSYPTFWISTVPVPEVFPPTCMFVFTGGMFLPYQWLDIHHLYPFPVCVLQSVCSFYWGYVSYLTIGYPPPVPVPGVYPTICMFVLLGVCSYLTIRYPPPVPVPGVVPYNLYISTLRPIRWEWSCHRIAGLTFSLPAPRNAETICSLYITL